MDKVAYLSQYRELHKEWCYLETHYNNTSSIAIGASFISGMPRGGGDITDKTFDMVLKKEALENKMVKVLTTLITLEIEIFDKVMGIKDSTLRQVLTLRYLQGMQWESVAHELGCTPRQAHNIHRDALDCLEL